MTDINPELIEKVAIATYDAMQHPNWRAPLWDEIDEPGRERFLNAARAALEAVADDIRTEALEDAADELHRLDDGRTGGYYSAGRHIIARLRERAAKLRGADQ